MPAPEQKVHEYDELLDLLRSAGFEIGIDQQLRILYLLDGVGCPTDAEVVKRLIRPIIVGSDSQQEEFDRVFDEMISASVSLPSPPDVEGRPPPVGTAHRRAPVGRLRLPVLISFAILVLVVAASVIWLSDTLIRQTPRRGPDTPAGLPADPARYPARQPQPSPTEWPIIPLVAGIGFLLLVLRVELRRASARPMRLRFRQAEPPYSVHLRATRPLGLPYASRSLLQTAEILRRRQRAEDRARFLVEESVSDTIAAGGLPTFRFGSATRVPDYLVMIERQSPRDHLAAHFAAVVTRLRAEHVHLTVYFYRDDPLTCYPESGEESVEIERLMDRFRDHNLLILGRGDRFIDPISGELAGWTTVLREWRRCAVFTPNRPATWGALERELGRGFGVFHASLEGLRAFVDHGPEMTFPPSLGGITTLEAPLYFRRRHDASIPALRKHLGSDGFQWLCACSVHPELHWELTLCLGSLSDIRRPALQEHTILRLFQLPWFRTGVIPSELRLKLLAEIEDDVLCAARATIAQVLEGMELPVTSGAFHRNRTQLLLQRLHLQRGQDPARPGVIDELSRIPTGEITRDPAAILSLRALYEFGDWHLLPRWGQRALFNHGIPLLGIRKEIRGLLVAVTLGMLLWAASPLLVGLSSFLRQNLSLIAFLAGLVMLIVAFGGRISNRREALLFAGYWPLYILYEFEALGDYRLTKILLLGQFYVEEAMFFLILPVQVVVVRLTRTLWRITRSSPNVSATRAHPRG
jgi:hypothetical protein